jgi:heme/copper-type cytochrome/quinol oxidase subunit 2
MPALRKSICLVVPTIPGILAGVLVAASTPAAAQPHVIDVVADRDSRYKVVGQAKAEITVKAREPVLLRIEARPGKTWNRDGTVHGFTLLRAKDHAKVPGWNLELRAGRQEFSLIAPPDPGEYEVVCTVICSDDHETMRMRFLVVP